MAEALYSAKIAFSNYILACEQKNISAGKEQKLCR